MSKVVYEPYHFVSFSVHEILEVLEDEDNEGEYLNLRKLTNDELDSFLHHCWRKGYNVWTMDGNPDFEELDRLAEGFANDK